MKRLVLAAAIVVVAVVAVLFVRGKSSKSEPKYVTAELQKGTIAITVTATGALEAVTTVQVGSQISGTLLGLYADFNDNVKKGQLLAQLDPTFLKAQVAQAQADMERERASAELARREYERALTLFETHLISESERDVTLTNYELAKAREKSAAANLDRVKTNLDYATIVSPIDGVVISRDVDVGQTVAASLQAPTLFTIAEDLARMQCKASIDEADIGKIKEDQAVQFTVDAYPDLSFRGRVKQIRLSPQIVQNVVSYDVIIELSNPDLLLKPGMTANVTVLVDSRENVIKAPVAALRFRPAGETVQGRPGGGPGVRQGGPRGGSGPRARAGAGGGEGADGASGERAKRSPGAVVWVLDPTGSPRAVGVQTGISDGTFVEIVSGDLKEGDAVIVSDGSAAASAASPQQVNPFAPQFPRRR